MLIFFWYPSDIYTTRNTIILKNTNYGMKPYNKIYDIKHNTMAILYDMCSEYR